MEMAKAATPSSTFCADLMMTLYCSAVSPINLPEATTAAVVSMVPPSHAPATSSLKPSILAMYGSRYIIGVAMMRTRQITKESFLAFPLMAPLVAIAADTPQMETALESSIDISLSILKALVAIQKLKYQTERTTITACIIPSAPALMISLKRIELPSITSPALIKYSLFTAGDSHLGKPMVLRMSNPIITAKNTDSSPIVLMGERAAM